MAKLSKSEANEFKLNNIIRLFLYLSFIVTGGILYTKSYLKTSAITTFLGVLFIIAGVIIVYINGKEKKLKLFNYDVYFGIAKALCGLLLIINPGNINNNLTFYFGLFLIFSAMQKGVVSYKLFKKNDDTKLLTMVTAIIILALGVLVMINPFSQIPLTQLCGIFILFYGVLQFANTVLLNSKETEFIKNK